jgi:hypothetical protein
MTQNIFKLAFGPKLKYSIQPFSPAISTFNLVKLLATTYIPAMQHLSEHLQRKDEITNQDRQLTRDINERASDFVAALEKRELDRFCGVTENARSRVVEQALDAIKAMASYS